MDRPYTHPFLLTLLCNYLFVLVIPSIDLVHSKLVRINSYLITCNFHPPFPLCKYQWSSTVEHRYRVWCCATVASKCVMSVAGFFVNFFFYRWSVCVFSGTDSRSKGPLQLFSHKPFPEFETFLSSDLSPLLKCLLRLKYGGGEIKLRTELFQTPSKQ